MRISDWSSDVCSSDLGGPRRSGHPPARASRDRGRLGDRLRTDMRSRKAAAAQARRFSRSAAPFLYQSPRMRGLRRLFGAVELHRRPAARAAGRTQATYRPVCVQQGLFVRERILSTEGRRGGEEWVSTLRSRWWPYTSKK